MLTEEQAGTIENPNEHKLICALPGSGKTHTFISLADRVLNSSNTNSVLMVTFTNASASEMEERLVKRLGPQLAKRTKAATFASLMLKQFEQIRVRRRSIIGPEQYSFVKRALIQAQIRYDDINEWVSTIEAMGRDIDYMHDGTPTSMVFEAYLSLLKKYKRFDLNMMCRELIAGLEGGTVKPYRYSHLLCDEFQDTDELQYRWLKAHGNLGKTLAVVGDDDQSIYSWRGSMGYHAFREFQNDFNASGYLLSKCFRCSPNILNAAKMFVENNEDRIDKDMASVKKEQGTVKIVSIPNNFISQFTQELLQMDSLESVSKIGGEQDTKKSDGFEQYRYVAQAIKQSEKDGWAILARTNKQLDQVERALSELQMKAVRIGGKSIFDNEHAVGFINLFYGLAHPKAADALVSGLGWIGESEETLHYIYQSCKTMGFASSQQMSGETWKPVTAFMQEMAMRAINLEEQYAGAFIDKLCSAVIKYLKKKKDADEKLQVTVVEICQGILKGSKGNLVARAKNLAEKTKKNTKQEDHNQNDAVILATMNGSKGLEWPRVWIIDVDDGKVPMIKGAVTREAIEEERRLLYVAMTRAEENLVISHRENKESSFIEEIVGVNSSL
ncbi:ATP-dependent helicase [Alteromonas gilva]|uniref:DNA 3'-5' helicase n=1 Tax=Alteromonas gilva TaxID=2987522 RepID=A0ABT5L9U5_9ALTE|nr:ATP-dependent helicase [Alteromonas gilva]MDC8832942.1 ATP-dependent helicase [Alteromonas gilva]